jgi:hypothetical protein
MIANAIKEKGFRGALEYELSKEGELRLLGLPGTLEDEFLVVIGGLEPPTLAL